MCRGIGTFQKLGVFIVSPSLPSFCHVLLPLPHFFLPWGPPLEASWGVWGSFGAFWSLKTTWMSMSWNSKNNKMTWIRQLRSLANDKSHEVSAGARELEAPKYNCEAPCLPTAGYRGLSKGSARGRPKVWLLNTQAWIFGVSRHPRHAQWLHHWKFVQ